MKSLYIIILVVFFSCQESLPKPKGYPRLEYSKAEYRLADLDCPFSFEYSNQSLITKRKENCWFTIKYPNQKAKIHLTYLPVNNNIQKLIKESQKLVYEHTVRASSIDTKFFSYKDKKVYGNYYTLGGESASNIHFYLTDSLYHFIEANVYFQARPNSDSLKPAVEYIGKDVLNLIETLEWKEK